MRSHRAGAAVLLPPLEVPTGNVHVLPPDQGPGRASTPPTPAPPAVEPGTVGPGRAEWVIKDGEGADLGRVLPSRSEALREMGVLAYRGRVSLPLILYGPDGRPTGDHLA
jgi:hypothetical protein